VAVKAGANIQKDGIWETTDDGTRTWRLSLECPGALGMSLCFDDFHLGDFTRLYIYDRSREVVLGAYTSFNNRNNHLFATELLPGDLVTLEINMDAREDEFPALSISEISYVYRNLYDYSFERLGSGSCEVNINCPEGDNWQKQKRGVARIYVKEAGGFYWCSGSLVNNTAQDLEPFLLTADHCASNASAEDLAQWIFYFNLEAPGCENPAGTPPSNTMTGAVKLASATTNGSDFFLVRLNEDVPASYQPFFNGWNAENIPSISGVTIHHPSGDIKKISTYNQQITNSQWGSIPNTHWQVIWAETLNGWGVTEGGSSGAPLFDNNGRIIGTLTGGLASCDNTSGSGPDQPDYFGKFSYSWDQNGEAPEQQLKYWLDPQNTGLTAIPGTNASLTANFAATPTILLAGTSVTFTNLSSGLPDTWEWTFEGGTPDAYIGQDPPVILYSNGGSFDVGLVVSDGNDTDSLYLKDYIQVVGELYPNPTQADINIYINAELPANVTAQIYDVLGRVVFEQDYPDQAINLINVDVSDFSAGIYLVRLTVKQRYIFGKFLKY
jgi:V8-like Glu-specific endopeptidase